MSLPIVFRHEDYLRQTDRQLAILSPVNTYMQRHERVPRSAARAHVIPNQDLKSIKFYANWRPALRSSGPDARKNYIHLDVDGRAAAGPAAPDGIYDYVTISEAYDTVHAGFVHERTDVLDDDSLTTNK